MQPFLSSANIDHPNSDTTVTRTILSLLQDVRATATFFVTDRFLERYPDVIREIHAHGHEIGTHGPKHIRLSKQLPEAFRNDLQRHKQRLQELVGIAPLGYRAPHFSLNEKTQWILPILLEEGYSYDSSLFAASSLEYGFQGAPNTPHLIQTPSGPIMEVPVPGFPLGNMRLPFAGGIYFRLIPAKIYAQLLKYVVQAGFGMVYFHPHELTSDTPKIHRGPWLKRFFKYYGASRGMARLKYLLFRFSFLSVRDTLLPKSHPSK